MVVCTFQALAGACPGTVFAAAGSGVAGTEYVLAGGIAGVSIFTALERTLLPKLFDRSKIAEPRLEKNLSQGNDAAKPWYGSFSKLALVSSLALGAAAVAFNKYFPNSSRYASPGEIRTLMDALKAPYWNPILSGMVVGSLQVPMVLFADTFLGTTSQFLSLIAPLQPIFRALGLADSKSEISKWSPIASAKTIVGGWGFVGMMAAGAYFSSTLSGTRNIVPGLLAEGVTAAPSLILDKAHPLIQPLVAGALLWFGSRTALGCTSGHGISGFSLLSVNSLVAVASMFGSGIAAAQILKNYV